MLQLLIQRSQDAVMLKCLGKMVAGEGLNLVQRTALAQHASSLTFDFSGVETLDAAGLGMLLRVRQWCDSQGTTLKLTHPNKHVREVLAVTSLDSVLEIYPTSGEDVEAPREWVYVER